MGYFECPLYIMKGESMNLVFGILGSVCLLYFVVVFLVGLDFSSIWLLAAVLFWGIVLIRHAEAMQMLTIGKAVKRFLMVLFGAAGIVFLAAEFLIISGMVSKPSGKLDYMIVLGAQVKGEAPSKALALRIEKAAKLWEESGEPVMVLSGGKGNGENISEAECMKRVLLEKGIPEEKLVMEDASTSTVENLKFCAKLTDCKEKRTGIVSNNFHVYRAAKLAKKMGYQNVCGIAARSDWRYQIHYMVREAFALIKEKLSGNI